MSAHGTFRRIAAMHNFGSYRRCSGHATSPSGASVRHECRVGPGNFITRFRHGSLALASLNLACRNLVPTFPQRSPPSLLTTAACGGLRSTPDCRPRRAFLHLSYSYAPPCGPALLVTQCQEPTCAVQQIALYSITSSARASSEGDMLSPSAFAVLRLMTSSNFVGC